MINRTAFWLKRPRERISTVQAIRVPAQRLEKLEYFFLFVLFLSCTTSYEVAVGSITLAPVEIIGWLFILWRWTVGGMEDAKPDHGVQRLVWVFRAFAIYAGILWLFSSNWLDRRGMFTHWVMAAILIDCLLRSRWRDWKPIAVLFILAALPNAVWGVLQHAMGIGLRYKNFFGYGRSAASFPIMGFFGHSNDLAVYLYWSLLACAGLVLAFRSWRRILYLALTLLYGLVLYWTISRSTLLTVGFVVIVVLFLFLFRRRKQFLIVAAIGAMLAALAVILIFLTQPLAWINHLLSGRLTLWNEGLQIIFTDKYLLPLGYLSMPSINIWWLPHNIYTLAWLEFGIPGLLLLIGWGGLFLYTGWKRYENLRTHFSAGILWAGIAGLFLINGMASLYFHESYVILNFLCVSALWTAQIRAIDAPIAPNNSGDPRAENELASGKVIPLSSNPTADNSKKPVYISPV